MDDHARRICAPLVAAWADFESGWATLRDLARLAEQAVNALDNANAPLPRKLATAASDLEYGFHANEREEHLLVGRRIMEPVLSIVNI